MARAQVLPMRPDDYATARGERSPAIVKVAEAYRSGGPCYAGFLDGKLLGVAGVYFLYPGVGEGWAVLTDWGRAHGRAIHRAVRDGFRQILAEKQPSRVHAHIMADDYTAVRWAMGLGFEPETPRLKGYGPKGEDFVLFVLFPKGSL